MNNEFAQQFCQHWLDAWNSHDIEQIMSHYAEELEFKSPLIIARYNDPSGTINSHEKLKEYFLTGLAKSPELKFSLKQMLLGVNALTLYYQNHKGGETAEYFEFNADNKVIRSASCYSQSVSMVNPTRSE